jgi:hypothetical protein
MFQSERISSFREGRVSAFGRWIPLGDLGGRGGQERGNSGPNHLSDSDG